MIRTFFICGLVVNMDRIYLFVIVSYHWSNKTQTCFKFLFVVIIFFKKNYDNVTICFIHSGEVEADYIGLMLMASAGYDPLVAPKVFKKIGGKEGGEF